MQNQHPTRNHYSSPTFLGRPVDLYVRALARPRR
jgi:hypothetical protein